MTKFLGSAAALAVIMMASPAAFAAPGDWRGDGELLGGPGQAGTREGQGARTPQAPVQNDTWRAPRAAVVVAPPADNFARDDREIDRGRDFARDNRDLDRGGDWRGARNHAPSVAQLRGQIERGLRSGALSRRDARDLMSEVRDLQATEEFYARGGLNWRERAQLDERSARLQDAIFRQTRERGDGRGDGLGGREDRRGDWR